MIEQTPAVTITDLHFAYNGETVLRDVNLNIEIGRASRRESG